MGGVEVQSANHFRLLILKKKKINKIKKELPSSEKILFLSDTTSKGKKMNQSRDSWETEAGIRICFSGQRPSAGTGKVIQHRRREKRSKTEQKKKPSNKIS